MKKILIGAALTTAGLMATGTAQAHTEDALLGGLIGLAVGVSIADDHHHPHRVVHHYNHHPVRYYAPPRHVRHHPRGHAYGYRDNHHKRHKQHRRHSRHDRHDGDRRDRDHRDRRGRH